MIAAPTDDMASVETEQCDIGGCTEPFAWEPECMHGPRRLRLCEAHSTRWLNACRDLDAELRAIAAAPKTPESKLDLAAISAKLERLGARLRKVERKPKPGTAKALAGIGRGDDKRRRARRNIR